MKINDSTVAFVSSRKYQQMSSFSISYTEKRGLSSETDQEQPPAASLRLSEGGLDSVRNFRQKLRALDDEPLQTAEDPVTAFLSKTDDTKLKMLKRMLEILRKGLPGYKKGNQSEPDSSSLLTPEEMKHSPVLDLTTMSSDSGSLPRTTLTRTMRRSEFFSEEEVSCFSGTGIVQSSDGRSISFQLDLELSRSFESALEITETTQQILCDPLVINLEAATASVSDQKFYFDLNTDGEQEAISFVGPGSGFLALDQNKDGVINDGSELFGTQSGDGFADLAAYDADRNGWIDENDAVYSKLRIWTKNSEGENELIDLKSAEVGAIFLGKASTEFHLNDAETNETNAVIRSTGIYLKENGQAATIQHVDLAL